MCQLLKLFERVKCWQSMIKVEVVWENVLKHNAKMQKCKKMSLLALIFSKLSKQKISYRAFKRFGQA